MNMLPLEERVRILQLLCEGMSIRAITRLTGASKNTVAKLLVDAGKVCDAFHNANVRNVKATRVQVDAIWSFNYAKQQNVVTAKDAPAGAGDTWTWTAIDADSKMILSYLVGGCDSEYAMEFMDDLASRLTNRVQLTSDGHRAYLEAVEGAFGCDMDYAQLVKLYGLVGGSSPDKPCSSAECTGIRKRKVDGKPDDAHVSTSYVVRQNLTNAFSKKVENHAHAVALHMMYYNFVRIHKTLRVTSAMVAGVADRLWEIADIAMLIEQAEAKPGKRGPYRKREISN